MKSLKLFSAIFLIALMFLLSADVFAQSTTTGTMKRVASNEWTWTVSSGDFDSAATIWSTGFYFEPTAQTTFDAQGSIDLGTVAAGGTYSTVLLLYASWDNGSSWFIADSLGTITATTSTKFDIDLDDADQAPQYKFKATNGGADNSIYLGAYKE